jgi:peroxidase
VLLGRRDGTATNIESARNLPNFFDPLDVLQEKFRNVNLDDTDLVALQGNNRARGAGGEWGNYIILKS